MFKKMDVYGKCSTEVTWVIYVQRDGSGGKCSRRGTCVADVQQTGRG